MRSLHLLGGQEILLNRPVIMGVLNVTPDSFSDGGQWTDPVTAAGHGLAMVQAGAQIIDVGGESTRPGSQRIPPHDQINRVRPTIERLRELLSKKNLEAAISIDTTQTAVAEAARQAGASILNDISAGREDPGIFDLAAQWGCPLVLMHMQGEPGTMQVSPTYHDVVEEVQTFLLDRARAAETAGVAREQVVIDPGIGFGKSREHNLALLANLKRFVDTGYPVLLGTSRKRFMGSICTDADGNPPAPAKLVSATCATTSLGVAAGVAIFRVHDIHANRQAADVSWRISQAASAG